MEVPCPKNTETWTRKGLQEADLPRLRVVPTSFWYESALKTPNKPHTDVFLKAKSRNSAAKIFHLKKVCSKCSLFQTALISSRPFSLVLKNN